MYAIEVENLVKKFGNFEAVKGVSFKQRTDIFIGVF